MKKFFIVGLALLLIGCSKNVPTCDNEEVLTTTQDIIFEYSQAATEEAVAMGISAMAGRAIDRNKMTGMPHLVATDINLSAIRNGKVVPEEQLRYCRATLSMTYPDLYKARADWRNEIVRKMINIQQEQGDDSTDTSQYPMTLIADNIANMAFMRIMHLSGDTEYQIAYSVQNTTTPDEFVVTVEPFLEILYEE